MPPLLSQPHPSSLRSSRSIERRNARGAERGEEGGGDTTRGGTRGTPLRRRLAGLELDFSLPPAEARGDGVELCCGRRGVLAKAARSRAIAILDAARRCRRRRAPAETADSHDLGASQSRFISFYLLLYPTFLPTRP